MEKIMLTSRREVEDLFDTELHPEFSSLPFKIPVVVRFCEVKQRKVICCPQERRSFYEEFTASMNEYYSSPLRRRFARQIEDGWLYAAKIDGNWCRVRLEGMYGRQSYLFLIDKGCKQRIKDVNLYELHDRFDVEHIPAHFALEFIFPQKEITSFEEAGFLNICSLKPNNVVDAFVLSNKEPFLSVFSVENSDISWGQLIDGFDGGSARLWERAASPHEEGKCRGVPCGSYPTPIIRTDEAIDATVAAFESLDRMFIRDPAQSLRLMFLERLLERAYNDEHIRKLLSFDSPRLLAEGSACVAWNAANKQWIRGRIVCISANGLVTDVAAVDYPPVVLRDLKLDDGEIVMLRTDLLFSPLCSLIRVGECADRLEMLIRWSEARQVLPTGSHVFVRTSSASTLAAVRFPGGPTLDEYIEQAIQVKIKEREEANLRYHMLLESNENAFSQSYSSKSDRCRMSLRPPFALRIGGDPAFTNHGFDNLDFPSQLAGVSSRPFSQSISFDNETRCARAPRSRPLLEQWDSLREDLFSQSLSELSFNGSHARYRPASPMTAGSAVLTSTPINVHCMPVTAVGPRNAGDEFRVPELPLRFKRQPSARVPNTFEREYLDRTLTSCDSDADSEEFTRSLQRSHWKARSISANSFSRSSTTFDADFCSDIENTVHENEKMEVVRVLNANNAMEIFLETAETKKRHEILLDSLAKLNKNSLESVSGKWVRPSENLLYLQENSLPQRVFVSNVKDDEVTLLCIDTGEEHYVDHETDFYRLPESVDISAVEQTCVGPVRLMGSYNPRWMTVSSVIKLRELCEKAVFAIFEREKSERLVTLFDANRRCINDRFIAFTKSGAAMRRKSSIRSVPIPITTS